MQHEVAYQVFVCVGATGLEPATPCSQSRYATNCATPRKIAASVTNYLLFILLAVRPGFEPGVRLLVRQFSKLLV